MAKFMETISTFAKEHPVGTGAGVFGLVTLGYCAGKKVVEIAKDGIECYKEHKLVKNDKAMFVTGENMEKIKAILAEDEAVKKALAEKAKGENKPEENKNDKPDNSDK